MLISKDFLQIKDLTRPSLHLFLALMNFANSFHSKIHFLLFHSSLFLFHIIHFHSIFNFNFNFVIIIYKYK